MAAPTPPAVAQESPPAPKDSAAHPRHRRLWPLGLYRVAGDSMLPTYRPGDTLLGLRWFRPRSGHIVVAQHNGRPLIKRLARLTHQHAWIVGDNAAASTDSRHFGPINRRALIARIILRLG